MQEAYRILVFMTLGYVTLAQKLGAPVQQGEHGKKAVSYIGLVIGALSSTWRCASN